MTVCSKCGGLKGDPDEAIAGTPCLCDDTRIANLTRELERVTRGAQLTAEALKRSEATITHLQTQLTAHTQALKVARDRLGSCVLFLKDYLEGTTHAGVSRMVSDCQDAIDTINNLLK